MAFQAKENSCSSESALVRLHCPHKNCDNFYVNKKNLNEHFRLNPSHKPDSLVTTRVRITAKECAEKFLDGEKTHTLGTFVLKNCVNFLRMKNFNCMHCQGLPKL